MEEVHCPSCDREVPDLPYCVSCGHRFAGERSGAGERYAAAPNERLWVPRVASTLFPRLPAAHLWPFRLALLLGIGVVVLLAVVGLYPVALAAAVVLVPAELALYLHAVDVYEDTPLRAVGLSLGWGAVTGAVFGLATARLVEPVSVLDGVSARDVLVQALAVPVAGAAVVLVGPLWLRRDARFNDTLDGVTFGSVAGAAFIGAAALTHASDLLSGGLRPPGQAADWVVRLLELGVLTPVTWSAAIGAIAAALWLRGGRERRVYSHPLAVTVAGLALLCAAAFAQLSFGRNVAPVVLIALAALGLVGLRLLIQHGLADEAGERATGPAIACANCGEQTPANTFCGRCGIALDALPKSVGEGRRRGDAGARIGRAAVVVLTGAAIAAVGAVTVVLAQAREVGPPPPRCDAPPASCAPPTRDPIGEPVALPKTSGARLAAGPPATSFHATGWGYSLFYPNSLKLETAGTGGLQLDDADGSVLAVYGTELSADAAVTAALAGLKLVSKEPMAPEDLPPGGPLVGLRHATGGVWLGVGGDVTGPITLLRIDVAAAASGGVTIVTLAVADIATGHVDRFLRRADAVANSIRWPGQLGA